MAALRRRELPIVATDFADPEMPLDSYDEYDQVALFCGKTEIRGL
jgi:hypothetical protein